MLIRSYTGRTVNEALQKVKADLGEAALIVETRPVKSGGIFGSQVGYEVVAAKEDAVPVRRPAAPAPQPPAPDSGLRQELAAIRSELQRLAAGREAPRTHLGTWSDPLLAAELPAEILGELDGALAGAGARLAPELTREFITRWLARGLPCQPGLDWDGVRTLMLVGPTGVGKTTTIAKLAGDLVLTRRRRVAIATIDTYRIGAQDQLRAYADLLDIPCFVAQTPAQLAAVLADSGSYDHVLIDTAGRSPSDSARVHELKGFCRAVPAAGSHRLAVMLAISATAGRAEFAQTVERFSTLPVEHCVITKLDECAAPGRLYGCLRRHHLAPAFVTTGQEVPSDIAAADPQRLAELVLGHALSGVAS
jgi:flagellar biosynthesis protein FlhF